MGGGDGRRSLPPGFRFRPTDEELLTHYLAPKAADAGFAAPAAIREADLYGAEPWDLLPAAGGAAAGYFFCRRSVKYPSGLRTNRATRAGYWKSTGKDKLVLRQHASGPIGLKKMLVFYRGRAPAGRKTDWVMHEYRLAHGHTPPVITTTGTQSEWVICRVFTRKPTVETSLPVEQEETVLNLPPLNDHLNPAIIYGCNGGGGTPAAAVATATDPAERANCFSSDALAITPPADDRLETAGQGALNLNYEELLINNHSAALDYAAAATPAPSQLLQRATLLGDELSADSFDPLPQLLDYEGFPFLHDF
ncbi:unnamed protein product [Urochloa decumbens]|uniref:NAC domain-containing protein n=1 Tax=Urochloa decumbens TaxID=240449 RepID=A0ABC9FG26_9POAL